MSRDRLNRIERAWCLYDWGNSAFATVCMTGLLPPLVVRLVNQEGGGLRGSAVWGWVAALGLLVGVVIGPPLGAFADSTRRRKKLLISFAVAGAAATMGLAVALPADWRIAAGLYVVAATGFGTANIFYDALLPGLGPPQRWDRISSAGYAYGYVGGGLVLGVAAVLATSGGMRGAAWAFVATGAWWMLFTVPVARAVPEPPAVDAGPTFRRLTQSLREVRRHPNLWRFLLAYWLYNDAIGTVIKMSGAYGADLGIAVPQLLGAFLLAQAVGVPATVWFGRLAERAGTKRAIELALGGYLGIALLALGLRSAWQFWLLAGLVGLVQGGAQALSRSMFARLVPAGREAEMFSFFDLSGRAAGVVGPLLFAICVGVTGSPRAGVPVIALLILAGAAVLRRVDVDTP